MEPGGHLEIVLLDFGDRAFSRDALDIAVRLITMTSHNRALSLLQNKIEMSRVDYNRDENKESLSAPLVQLLPSSSIFHGITVSPYRPNTLSIRVLGKSKQKSQELPFHF